MGFEQLAALRDQLAAQAAKNAREKRQDRDGRNDKAPAGRGDPPHNGKDAAPAQAAQPGRRSGQAGNRPHGKGDRSAAQPQDRRGRGSQPRAAQPPREPVDPVVMAISRLQRQFPQAFPKKPAPKLPLKLGIHNDLYAQAESLKLEQPQIKEAIKTWCQGSRYWACLVADATRVDLSGQPAGTVTAEEEKRAKQLASRQRWQARNAQKKAAGEKPAAASTDADAATQVEAPAATPAAQDNAAVPVQSDAAAQAKASAPQALPESSDQATDAAAAPDAAVASDVAGAVDAPVSTDVAAAPDAPAPAEPLQPQAAEPAASVQQDADVPLTASAIDVQPTGDSPPQASKAE